MSRVDILLIGSEIPEWFFHCKEGSMSFLVPQDLCDKFLGLALCVVLGLEEGKVADALCEVKISVEIYIDGQMRTSCSRWFFSLESDHVWLQYFPRSSLWEGKKLLQNDWSHFKVCLEALNGSIKKCGFRPICEQHEDHTRVILQNHQLIETE